MSRAAGTLQTTYNATYYPPAIIPGYQGHVPSTQFQYGETFGNVTAKYFQDYRNETLSSTQGAYARGGYFPTPYTNQPELVMSDRRRSRDQYLNNPKYELKNVDTNRTDELRKFHQLSQEHRDTYIDRSGTLHPVEHFTLPVPNATMYETNLPYSSMLLRHTADINISTAGNFPPVRPVPRQTDFQIFPSVNSSFNPDSTVSHPPPVNHSSTTTEYIC